MFDDRQDAGRQLAQKLDVYKGKGVLVLAIPRGGVAVGYEVAKELDADFSILVTRKLPFPTNPEAGFGAVAEDGSRYINEEASAWLSGRQIESIVERQRQEVRRRIAVLRQGDPLPDMEGRTVILVDDGIAMGSTMRASIECCKNQGAEKIVVGVPVSGGRAVGEIEKLVDEVVVVEQPERFRAVAQVYRNWYDVPDREVLDTLERWRERVSEEE